METLAFARAPRQKGRAYYDRKKAAGKTSMESMRCLNRRGDQTERDGPGRTLGGDQTVLRPVPDAPTARPAAVVKRSLLDDGEDRRTSTGGNNPSLT